MTKPDCSNTSSRVEGQRNEIPDDVRADADCLARAAAIFARGAIRLAKKRMTEAAANTPASSPGVLPA